MVHSWNATAARVRRGWSQQPAAPQQQEVKQLGQQVLPPKRCMNRKLAVGRDPGRELQHADMGCVCHKSSLNNIIFVQVHFWTTTEVGSSWPCLLHAWADRAVSSRSHAALGVYMNSTHAHRQNKPKRNGVSFLRFSLNSKSAEGQQAYLLVWNKVSDGSGGVWCSIQGACKPYRSLWVWILAALPLPASSSCIPWEAADDGSGRHPLGRQLSAWLQASASPSSCAQLRSESADRRAISRFLSPLFKFN